MEHFWKNPVNIVLGVATFVDMEPLHEGKQSELMHMNEWFRPSPSPFWVPGIALGLGDKGVMKVRNGGHVPGAASHGTCKKAARVIYNVGDDHSKNIQGKSVGGGRGHHRSLGRSVRGTHPPDSGLISVPNSYSHGEQPDRCT